MCGNATPLAQLPVRFRANSVAQHRRSGKSLWAKIEDGSAFKRCDQIGQISRLSSEVTCEGSYASQIGGEDRFRGCVLLDDRSLEHQRICEGDQLLDSLVGTWQICSVEKHRCHFSRYGVNLGLCRQLSSKQWFVAEFENKGVAGFHVVAAVRKCLDKFGDHACQISNAQFVLTLRRWIENGCSLFGVGYRAFGKGVDDEFEERESSCGDFHSRFELRLLPGRCRQGGCD